MITIFTTLRPLKGKFNIIQKNAIISWSKLRPKVNIILVGDDYGTASLARKVGAKYVAKVRRNTSGVPYLNSFFKVAHRKSKDEIFAYLNSDIILFNDFVKAVDEVSKKMDKFLMLGRRIDLQVDRLIDFDDKKDVEKLKKAARNEGKLHDYQGLDYFVYPRGLWRKIPSFAIGRTSIDGWLVYEASRINNNVVDSTKAITAIHQNHDYSSVPGLPVGTVTRTGVVFERENARNLRLANNKFGNARSVNFILTSDLRFKKYNRTFDYEKNWVDFKKHLNHFVKYRLKNYIQK